MKVSLAFLDAAPGIGGAEISLVEICRRLESDTTVICAQQGRFGKYLRDAGIAASQLSVPALREGGLFSKCMNYASIRKIRRGTAAVLRDIHADILISNNLMADFMAGSAPDRFCKKTVCWVRDDPRSSITAKYIKTRDLAVAPSKMIQEHLVSMGVGRTALIYNGIDIDYFENIPDKREARELLGLPREHLIIGSAGQLIQGKGWESFIACAERLSDRFEDIVCIIAGENMYAASSYPAKLRKAAASSRAEEHIRILGFQKDMRPFYSACDIYVTLSRNEPFGRTPLEAALCGTLPVASDEGGYAETLGTIPDLLVDPDDTESVCALITHCAENEDERSRLLEKARTRAHTFSADRAAREFEKAVTALL